MRLSSSLSPYPQEQVSELEAVFDGVEGDLGISVQVNDDGAVTVSQLRRLRGHAETSCPMLQPGDVLVRVDQEDVSEEPFKDVMTRLRQPSTTTLEFLRVERFDDVAAAVTKWRKAHRDNEHEGEFDVTFDALQPTGLRFTEGYLMATTLKLAHVEATLLEQCSAVSSSRQDRKRLSLSLLGQLLVRVNDDAVLGEPVDDVMALLYDRESFPKTLWLAQPDDSQQDLLVVTLTNCEQLKWLCFVPVEMMLEAPVVSYAALSESSSALGERQDGVREQQYLIAINGVPTLCVSSGSFRRSSNRGDDVTTSQGVSHVRAISTALERLLPRQRVLRFRDLTEYRREALAHQPLSPWQRRSSTASSAASSPPTSSASSSSTSSPSSSSSPPYTKHVPSGSTALVVTLERRPRDLRRLLLQLSESADNEAGVNSGGNDSLTAPQQLKRYIGIRNCEGRRSHRDLVLDNIRVVTMPSNRSKPLGITLETDVLTHRTVFKGYMLQDSPAMLSGCVEVGDTLVAINDRPIEDIPTDELVQLLHNGPLEPSKRRLRLLKHRRQCAVSSTKASPSTTWSPFGVVTRWWRSHESSE
ncbi:hypothetical protein PINS_up004049 [Pythium insidiosum]|nr:hypothetical protein PINS_up004049 [Pythium insidiosum]